MGTTSPRPRACASRSARGSPAGSPSTASPSDSAMPRADPRGLDRRRHRRARSRCCSCRCYEDVVHGVHRRLRARPRPVRRRRRDDADDLRRGSGAGPRQRRATSSACSGQQLELEHQLEGQRRLLEVNERLLSTLEPAGVLDLIADSLKAIVPYDSLTIYRVDRVAGVRRAVLARDRFADQILAHESPLGPGITGWVIDHGEAVLANEAHLDDRAPSRSRARRSSPSRSSSSRCWSTARRSARSTSAGWARRRPHFSPNEFELTKLFAGQASIALQNAEAHGEVRVRADQDALTGLRNHGSFQRELGEAVAERRREPFAVLMLDLDAFKAFNDTLRPPGRRRLLVEIAAVDGHRHPRRRPPLPLWRRRVRGDPARRRPPRRPRGGRADPACRAECRDDRGLRAGLRRSSRSAPASPASRTTAGRRTSSSPWPTARCTWSNRRTAGVPPQLPPIRTCRRSTRRPWPCWTTTTRSSLLETILGRAAALLGTPHGYIYLARPGRRGARRAHRRPACSRVPRASHARWARGSAGRVMAVGAAARHRRLRRLGRSLVRRSRRACSARSSACR